MSDLTTMDEIKTYFLINEIGHIIWLMNHEMADGRIPEKEHPKIDAELLNMRKTQVQAISSLHRFGIKSPFQNGSERPSAEYWAWFHWWDGYIKGLLAEEWATLDKKLKNDAEVSNYRPQGDWKLNIAKEEKVLQEAEAFWKAINQKTEN